MANGMEVKNGGRKVVCIQPIFQLSQLGDSIRSPRSQNLQDYVTRAYNAGLIRWVNNLLITY